MASGAFLFAGVSGAGKTPRSAAWHPDDVTLLTDEISYVRPVFGTGSSNQENRNSKIDGASFEFRISNFEFGNRQLAIDHRPSYLAFGTPFAGELARIGENLRAPIAALYLLTQGPENRIEPVSDAEATRALLQSILFFAQDEELVRLVFQSAAEFVSRVPVRRLVFVPDGRVWQFIDQ